MPRKYIQSSDIRRLHDLIRAEQGSLREVMRREPVEGARVQGLSVVPGQKVLDKVTNKKGEVIYATRKTVILPYTGGPGQRGSPGQT